MIDLNLTDISKIKKTKNIFFDEKNGCLVEISKIYNLKKSRATKLALIYFENRKHIDKNDNEILLPNKKFEDKSNEECDIDMLDDFIRGIYNKIKAYEIIGIVKILGKYSIKENLIIIDNLKHLSKDDTFIFLNNFEVLDENKQIKKYNLNEINNLTLYFLLKNKNIDLFDRYKKKDKKKDKRRNRIVDFIYIMENDLVRSGIGSLLRMENPGYSNKKRKKIKLLEELIENRFIN